MRFRQKGRDPMPSLDDSTRKLKKIVQDLKNTSMLLSITLNELTSTKD